MYLASTLKSNRELLEKIRDEEEEFRNRKIQLEKDIELGEIQQKLIEKSGTIEILKTQILKLSENIEGKLLPNNYRVVAQQYSKDYREYCTTAKREQHKGELPTNITRQIYLKGKMEVAKEILNNHHDYKGRLNKEGAQYITLKEFVKNISELDEDTKNSYLQHGGRNTQCIRIPPQIKIYDDIIPIFDTILSVLKKQQEQLDKITK